MSYLLIIHTERDDVEHAATRAGRPALVQPLVATTADEARAAAAAWLRATPGVLSGGQVGSLCVDLLLVSTLDPKTLLADYQAEAAATVDADAKAKAEAQIHNWKAQWPDLNVDKVN